MGVGLAYITNFLGFKDMINSLLHVGGNEQEIGFDPGDDISGGIPLGVSEYPLESYNPYEPQYYGMQPEAYPLNYDIGLPYGGNY
jgi:hypothetical protein